MAKVLRRIRRSDVSPEWRQRIEARVTREAATEGGDTLGALLPKAIESPASELKEKEPRPQLPRLEILPQDVNPSERSNHVGYKKPPLATRFKKGQSGNPRGRPPKIKNFKAAVRELLSSRVQVQKNGKIKKTSTLEAALLILRNKGLAGDLKANNELLKLAMMVLCGDTANADAPINAADKSNDELSHGARELIKFLQLDAATDKASSG